MYVQETQVDEQLWDWVRSKWTIGSICEVYDESSRLWLRAVATKEPDSDGMVEVAVASTNEQSNAMTFAARNTTAIRPLTAMMPIYRYIHRLRLTADEQPATSTFDLTLFDAEEGAEQEWRPNLERIKAALKYQRVLMANGADAGRQQFVDFLVSIYGSKRLLTDYIDFIDNHTDSASAAAIVRDLGFECEDVDGCRGAERHFLRERAEAQRVKRHRLLGLIDTIHFNLFHLKHVGLRMDAPADADEAYHDGKKEDAEESGQALEVAKEIALKQVKPTLQRYAEEQPSKFVMAAVDAQKGAYILCI